ncbi:SGNH/GDSL hydrolase family protein [Rhodopirellula islandica]|uniref:GDSL-type esterase/lipase family protein n=1 Tax=Rhodopirellula islandica TaxID=595434 RepID=UPI00064B2292|nr:GDSL-type esterase/lipase family protein [Rhodopirellula islandica]
MKYEPFTDDGCASEDVRAWKRRRRRWTMRLMASLLACLPVLLLELGLRGLDNSEPQAIDYDPYVGLNQLRPLFVLNEESDRWEIPSERYNFFRPESFSAKKAPGTRRVFVLGGSTVQGRPYATETAFSTWLRLSLESADRETKYEVINCGGTGYASYRVAKILDEVLEHEPDAIVLYTGHNEFLEDRTYAHVREMGTVSRWATGIGSKLHTVRWVQSLFIASQERPELAANVDMKLDHPGGLDSYQRDPSWQRGVEEHFAATLEKMVERTQKNNLPLIVCVPASDLVNTPPFKMQTRADWTDEEEDRFRSAWTIACDLELNPTRRIDALRECLRIDRDHAGANYALGRLLYDQGDSDSARPYVIAARDHDVCPLRAPSAIIGATREIADRYGVPLVDTPALLDERNVHGDMIADQVPDPGRFVDHVHPSIAGHQRIAAALALEFQKLGWVALTESSAELNANAVKEHLGMLGQDYYVRGKQRLEGLRLWTQGRAGQLATEIDEDPSNLQDKQKRP